jgi:hypothetical protein
MEAAISCKFHCKRLAEPWRGYWPATDSADDGLHLLLDRLQPGHSLETAGLDLEGRPTSGA